LTAARWPNKIILIYEVIRIWENQGRAAKELWTGLFLLYPKSYDSFRPLNETRLQNIFSTKTTGPLAMRTWNSYKNMMKPISVEIITHVLTVFGHCNRCKLIFAQNGFEKKVINEALAEYPNDLQEELRHLSEWISELTRLYRHRIRITVIDAKSLAGLYKCLRYGLRTYPAFIINKKDRMAGWDRDKLFNLLDVHIKQTMA
jgi:hypothetical protein